MKGNAGRVTCSGSDKPKHPEDAAKKLSQKKIPKASAGDDEDSEEEDTRRSAQPETQTPRVLYEPKKKKVAFSVPSGENTGGERSKKPSLVPYVMVPPLRSPEKVKPNLREEPMPVVEKRRPAYKLKAPIEDEQQADTILKHLEDQKIEITQGQLLGISTVGFRRKFVERLLPRKAPLEPGTMRVLQYDDYDEEEREIDEAIDQLEEDEEFMHMDELPVATFLMCQDELSGLKQGTIIMEDPYEQYVSTLQPGEKPKGLIVARESHHLKAVFPLINGKGHAETLLDSGSQIVSMAQDSAERLGLSWDPDFTIRMQSANRQVESTKGLVRNVPFRFGDLTIYLQVHVISAAAYEVLLGKPFEILTESNVKTRADGSVELTLTDPNTQRKLVVPTYNRGCGPKIVQREPRIAEPSSAENPNADQDFQSSMN